MPEASPERYVQSFEKFLEHTDEKRVFIEELGGYIERYQPHSVLDIGAGNGSLAIPLSRQVEEYEAIEQNPKYAGRLRAAGITVVEGSFPVQLRDTYDLVVMSHVISYEAANHNSLIPPAWDGVAPDGHLLIVTHRGGEDDDWSRLLTSIGMDKFSHYSAIYAEIMAMLSQRGEVEVRKVITTLDTDNVDDMLEAMAFVASNGRPESYQEFMDHREELSSTLNQKYKTEAGYSFPYQHIFVNTHRVGN